MIFQQINKYPEPTPPTTYHSQQVTWPKSEEDNKKWADLCETHINIAKNLMEKGDTVLTAEGSMPQIRITISHFLEDPAMISPYKNEPCFIMAYNPKYQSTGPTRYALHELDLSSIVKKETPNAN